MPLKFDSCKSGYVLGKAIIMKTNNTLKTFFSSVTFVDVKKNQKSSKNSTFLKFYFVLYLFYFIWLTVRLNIV